ncbi:MAG TPA: penicillin-binding protein activator, partial [Stellaceae bacterium]|nr:penicillin-binding protein activator [Stellaceae bacterium]
SGANAGLGKAILDAAQLALFETGRDMTLVPRDTGGTPAGAAAAAHSAIADGARLILGPLLAAEVEAVKPIARDAHVNIIAFSTVTRLAGDGVFLMGFLPRQEVVREVGYAHERGLDRFAALAPDTPYGHLMAEALRDVAAANGGTVAKVAFYGPSEADSAAAIRTLGGAPAGNSDAAAAAPAPPFGALLVPEGGARLDQIAGQLQQAGLDQPQVRLLGSGLWDVPDIGKDPALVGGWFAASPPDPRRAFDARFQATYGHAPPRLASLGFDAAALAAVLAHEGGAQPFSQQAILNPSGFTGVDGLFRFTPNGLVERGLAVLEVAPQGAVVVSPAPQSFAAVGG